MRTLSLAAVLLLAATGVAEDKPAKWEYAELTYRIITPRGTKGPDGAVAPGGPQTMTLRWITGAGEDSFKGWDEMAEKMKSPLKKDLSPASQKIQMLNRIGADGWELMDQQGNNPTGFNQGAPTTLLFKRRVP